MTLEELEKVFAEIDAPYKDELANLWARISEITEFKRKQKRIYALEHHYTNPVLEAIKEGKQVVKLSYPEGDVFYEIDGQGADKLINEFHVLEDLEIVTLEDHPTNHYAEVYKIATNA